jgi:hypothetical protein
VKEASYPSRSRIFTSAVLAILLLAGCQSKDEAPKEQREFVELQVSTPMTAPEWAVEQRKLFALYDSAVRLFDEKYLTNEGFLDVMEAWGGRGLERFQWVERVASISRALVS